MAELSNFSSNGSDCHTVLSCSDVYLIILSKQFGLKTLKIDQDNLESQWWEVVENGSHQVVWTPYGRFRLSVEVFEHSSHNIAHATVFQVRGCCFVEKSRIEEVHGYGRSWWYRVSMPLCFRFGTRITDFAVWQRTKWYIPKKKHSETIQQPLCGYVGSCDYRSDVCKLG